MPLLKVHLIVKVIKASENLVNTIAKPMELQVQMNVGYGVNVKCSEISDIKEFRSAFVDPCIKFKTSD